MTNWGSYDAEPVRHVLRCRIPYIVMQVVSRGGGLADAVYAFEGPSHEPGHSQYRLVGIHEWLPPMHPSLVGRPDRQPTMRLDGGLDMEAEAVKRRREWAQLSQVDGGPQWEADEDEAV